jgi:hypothetical protein
MLSLELDLENQEPIFKEGELHGLSHKTVLKLIGRFEIEYLRSPVNFLDLLEVVE